MWLLKNCSTCNACRLPNVVGIEPVSEFRENLKNNKLAKFPRLLGIVPVREFWSKNRYCSCKSLPILDGIVPVSKLSNSFKVFSLGRSPNELGIVPVIEFWFNRRNTKLVHWPKLDGIVPTNAFWKKSTRPRLTIPPIWIGIWPLKLAPFITNSTSWVILLIWDGKLELIEVTFRNICFRFNDSRPMEVGNGPDIMDSWMAKYCILVINPIEVGNGPKNLFWYKYSPVTDIMLPSPVGSVPVIKFVQKSKVCRNVRTLMDDGMVPTKEIRASLISKTFETPKIVTHFNPNQGVVPHGWVAGLPLVQDHSECRDRILVAATMSHITFW